MSLPMAENYRRESNSRAMRIQIMTNPGTTTGSAQAYV